MNQCQTTPEFLHELVRSRHAMDRPQQRLHGKIKRNKWRSHVLCAQLARRAYVIDEKGTRIEVMQDYMFS